MHHEAAPRIPAKLVAACRLTPEREAWLKRLPALLADLQRRWGFSAHAPFDGEGVSAAWVARVTRDDGTRAVLKLGMPHFEAEHEVLGLRFWDGDPTVRLLAADEAVGAMLLENCDPGTPLTSLPEAEQDIVIADLLRRLWRSPKEKHPFRPLSALTAHWAEAARRQADQWWDPVLVGEGLRLLEELPRSAPEQVLLATDLHAGNVLRARRKPWLVIDPKPFVGDPAYDATQHLLNCAGRVLAESDRTLRGFAERLKVDHERVRLWLFARLAAEPGDDWRHLRPLARVLAP